MPAVGRFNGTPASINASEEPQTVAIEDEPFGDLGDGADSVGEFRRRRQHWVDRAPSELAVADFTPSGRAHSAGLAHGIGREVVMQQEALLVGAFQRVDELFVLAGAERGDDERLCLTTREQRRTVGARQHADLGHNRAHRRQIAPVDAAAVIENVPAHDLGLGAMERLGDRLFGEFGQGALGRHGGFDLRFHRVDGGVAILLVGDRIGGAQIRLRDLEHGLLDSRFVDRRQLARLFGGLFGEPDDRLDDRLKRSVACHHGLQHRLFGKLLGLRFDHQHRIGGAGDDEVEHGILQLLQRRIDDDLVLDIADTGAADRAHERHARQRQRGGGRDHRQNVGIGLHVMAENRDDDLGLAAEVVGKQRADRPIYQARSQRLLIGESPFALQEAAGNAAGSEGLLLIVDRQREEILPRLGGLGGDDRRQYSGLAPTGEHSAIGLAGDTAGFEHEFAPAQR